MFKVRSYIRGPFWAGLKDFLLKASMECDIDLKIIDVTGLIYKTYYFTIESESKESIDKFNSLCAKAICDYKK